MIDREKNFQQLRRVHKALRVAAYGGVVDEGLKDSTLYEMAQSIVGMVTIEKAWAQETNTPPKLPKISAEEIKEAIQVAVDNTLRESFKEYIDAKEEAKDLHRRN